MVSRLQIDVSSAEDFIARFGKSIAEGGGFFAHRSPPAPGTQVTIDFVLPSSSSLCRVVGRVAHARAARDARDAAAGMAVRYVKLDVQARRLLEEAGLRVPDVAAPRPHAASSGVERLQRLDAAESARREGPIVGIDLGTTNSCVAYAQNGVPRVLATGQGYETIPSVVFIGEDKQVLVGHAAVQRMLLEPERAVYGSKRFLGRPYTSLEVGMFAHFFQYSLTVGKAGLTGVKIGSMNIPLEVMSGYILWQMRKTAEENLRQPVTRAVITVPAYFGETQRKSVRDAAHMAGLHVERLLTEPTAAAVAYGYGRRLSSTILVYDLGGGTFDASVLRIENDSMEVLATDGDAFLGGSDFDDRLCAHVIKVIEKQHGISLVNEPVAMQRVRMACEQAKVQLSAGPTARIELRYLTWSASGPINFEMLIDRALFEDLTRDLMDRSLSIAQQALTYARVRGTDLDDVILAGGQSRTPRIGALLAERFGKKTSRNVHPDHAVALGAALLAETLSTPRASLTLVDVLPASIRLSLANQETTVLLKRGDRVPARAVFDVRINDASGKPLAVSLCRGEFEAAAKNQPLGTLRLPDDMQGEGGVRVTVQVDVDGLIKVSAHTLGANKQVAVTLALTSGDTETLVEGDELGVVA